MDIVELGLLYDVEVEGPKVHVTFSLTSMGCPVGPMIQQQIEETVTGMEGDDRLSGAAGDQLVRTLEVFSRPHCRAVHSELFPPDAMELRRRVRATRRSADDHPCVGCR